MRIFAAVTLSISFSIAIASGVSSDALAAAKKQSSQAQSGKKEKCRAEAYQASSNARGNRSVGMSAFNACMAR